jgi:hypothetical protein
LLQQHKKAAAKLNGVHFGDDDNDNDNDASSEPSKLTSAPDNSKPNRLGKRQRMKNKRKLGLEKGGTEDADADAGVKRSADSSNNEVDGAQGHEDDKKKLKKEKKEKKVKEQKSADKPETPATAPTAVLVTADGDEKQQKKKEKKEKKEKKRKATEEANDKPKKNRMGSRKRKRLMMEQQAAAK